MRRLILLVILTAAFLALSSTPLRAQTQITLSNSGQNVSFQVISATSMDIALGTCTVTTFTGTCTLSGNAFFDPGDIATYTMTTVALSSMTISTTGTPGVFSITGATTSFSYSGDGDSLTGTITWTNVLDGSTTPILNGVLKITSISSTAGDFTALFGGVNSLILVNITLSGLSCSAGVSGTCSLDNLLAAGPSNTASSTLGHASLTPSPEPGSLVLLGSGLVAVGLYLRRRWVT